MFYGFVITKSNIKRKIHFYSYINANNQKRNDKMVLDTFGIELLYNKTIYIVLCIIIVENQVGALGS